VGGGEGQHGGRKAHVALYKKDNRLMAAHRIIGIGDTRITKFHSQPCPLTAKWKHTQELYLNLS
jgi:hypothetical protein